MDLEQLFISVCDLAKARANIEKQNEVETTCRGLACLTQHAPEEVGDCCTDVTRTRCSGLG